MSSDLFIPPTDETAPSSKDVRAQAKAEKAYAKASRPWFKKKRFIAPLAVVTLVVAISGSGGDTDGGTDAVVAEPADSAAAPAAPAANEPARATQDPAPEAQAPAPAPEPALSRSQQNALRSAEAYLAISGFSRSGLIEQLKFEGYPAEDATLAVDALDANWNEQAARSAEAYLEMTAFSRSGLIEQLQFEGYSREQAEYGVNQTGL